MDFVDDQMDDIPTRPMRVKILYTFDKDNSTNCLARIPDILQIPAVAIDETSQVGVIELRQCIQAIVSASPELISRLSDGDFAIYAYDYSEYETPLVGQGRLSAALSVATPTQQNRTMITGRVCKNMLALFSNGVKETLEVKLRLVPVPQPAQSHVAKNADMFRSQSPAMSGGFDPNAWNAPVQQTNSQLRPKDYFNFEALAASGDEELTLVDDLLGLGSKSSGSGSGHELGGGVGVAETRTDGHSGFNPAFASHSHSAPGSRAGSPMIDPQSNTRNDALRHQSFSGHPFNLPTDQSRPVSRASVRSEVQPSHHQRQASIPSFLQQHTQPPTEVYYNEDGQSRKRVKVTQTDWTGKSSFGSKSADLRVTAATAASMQMHRPIAKRPSAPGSNLEPPPRVPTPVPQMNPMLLHQQQQQPDPRRSLLRQTSTADSDFMSDFENFSDAVMSSPEDDSPSNSITAEGTPQEFPSSPPVFTGINLPQPSSPGLPTLPPPRMADSGYMSERSFNSCGVVESLENVDDRTCDALDNATAARYRSQSYQTEPFIKTEGTAGGRLPRYLSDAPPANDIGIQLETPGDMNQLPQKMLLNLPPGRRRDSSQGPKLPKPLAAKRPKATRSTPSTFNDGPMQATAIAQAPTPTPTAASALVATALPTVSEPPPSRRGSIALPPNPPAPSYDSPQPNDSLPAKPAPKKRQSIQRSRTTSNESEAGSPAPSDTEGGRPRGPNRSGSGAQRRKVIEQRLQNSIAKGEMPQYCTHCGAIETPTWRRLYVKYVDGKPSPLDSAEGEGETIGVQTVEVDDTGEVTRHVIRKAMKKTKDAHPGIGFDEVVVCNPCGLWFNKFRNMRPSDKWNRKSGTRKSRKHRDGELGITTDGFDPQSDAFMDQMGTENTADDEDGDGDTRPDDDDAPGNALPQRDRRPRASSMQPHRPKRANSQENMSASQLSAALTRAVQSSPVLFHGSQRSPIEVEDLTPKPTRRVLFPSPRREGEVMSLDDNGQTSLNATASNKEGLQKFSFSPKFDLEFDGMDSNVFETFTSFNKENMAPPLDFDEDDDLSRLLRGSSTSAFKTPRKSALKSTTTPRSMRKESNVLKTPTPSSKKRKPLTPNANAANNANMVTNDFMTSPSSNRYFLRSTPSRLERTPGRHSSHGGNQQVSPWSHHLALMLSDANQVDTFSSPSRQFSFSDLPTFMTPGRIGGITGCDWEGLEGMLSSEFIDFSEAPAPEGDLAGEGQAGGSE